jgi:ribosomal protein S12 methylthiotransferase accessory factor
MSPTDSDARLADRLRAAAAALTGIGSAPPGAAGLLRYLRYDDGDAAATAGRVRMLLAAAGFRRLFQLPVPDAPGLVFFGAEGDPATLAPHNAGLRVGGFAGSGLDPRRAFESCVGEGIEYLSQFAQPDDPLRSATFAVCTGTLDPVTRGFVEAILAASAIPADRAIDWIPVRRLPDGAATWLPADLCLRRATPDFVLGSKLSTGCAAGVTRQAATLRALLELIERDAVALWWRGGRRGRAIASDSETGCVATTLLARLRREQDTRQTMLLDISTDLCVPVVAAFSFRHNQTGFALGVSARPDFAEAARSAIFEMCQSELSLHVITVKRRESGEGALNESDRRQLTRAATLDPHRCLLLQPDDTKTPTASDGQSIIQQLAKHQIVAYSLDLTRSRFDIPVVRVIAPGLQSEPGEIITDRLTRTIAETGGGAQYTGGVALL